MKKSLTFRVARVVTMAFIVFVPLLYIFGPKSVASGLFLIFISGLFLLGGIFIKKIADNGENIENKGKALFLKLVLYCSSAGVFIMAWAKFLDKW
ncbi:MAG: hypothetical protein KKF46_00495 [Nanoarchaeota archaeon]|nr:hypothetical protein [Nanoarchaeota archaeon]MBU1320813.1 hypothetical protein [Nanoarchaeota archaeon]MBU1596823.1 hypothetical protein [Nanoarchaeota archaeon]MBU2440891.1 hypothetical protein [Nanoarchaeota archaeon]